MNESAYTVAAIAAICVPVFSWLMAAVICEAWKCVARIEAEADIHKFELLLKQIREEDDEPFSE